MANATIDLDIPIGKAWEVFRRVTDPIVDAGCTIQTAWVRKGLGNHISAYAASVETDTSIRPLAAVYISNDGVIKYHGCSPRKDPS